MKKAIKIALIIFLITSMLFVLTACGKEEEKTTNDNTTNITNEQPAQEQKVEFSMGEWNNNVYTNDFLGLKFNLPEGWTYSSDEEIAEMMNLGIELLNDDQKAAAELSKLTSVYYIAANNPNTGDSVAVMSEKPSMDVTTEFYINQLKSQLSTVESVSYEIGEIAKEQVADREYDTITATTNVSGIKIAQKYYVYKMDEYFVAIIATSVTGEDGIKDIIKSFE